MARQGWRFGALVALSSCIIYRVEPEPRPGPDVPGPEEPAPLPGDLYLVVDEGEPGDALRTTLESRGGDSLDGLQIVRFARDITVVDAVYDLREADLVIAIADEAEPGGVDLVAQFEQGRTVRVGDAFTILSDEIVGPTGDTGSTTTGDTGP